MDDANDDKRWPELVEQAQAKAKEQLPDTDALEYIKRAASRAKDALGRAHAVPFDPGMWMVPPLDLPDKAQKQLGRITDRQGAPGPVLADLAFAEVMRPLVPGCVSSGRG